MVSTWLLRSLGWCSALRRGGVDRVVGPGGKLFAGFEDFGRHLEIFDRHGAPGLLVSERPHAPLNVSRAGLLVGSKIEPSVHQNREETVGLVQAVSAEHGFGAQFGERAELVQDKLFERLISPAATENTAGARRNPSFGCRLPQRKAREVPLIPRCCSV